MSLTSRTTPEAEVCVTNVLSPRQLVAILTRATVLAVVLGSAACSEPTNVQATFVELSAGVDHTCGVRTDGDALCWGRNSSFELGDGTVVGRSTRGFVAGVIKFQSISAGFNHSCGVAFSGKAYCWGYNFLGQLGDGTLVDRSTPTAVVGGLTFIHVSAGFFHTCGVATDHLPYCWGAGGHGQLGTPAYKDSQPVLVSGGLHFSSVSAGQEFTCGITTEGRAYCWGRSSAGQLGNGSTSGLDGCTGCSQTPVAVLGGLTFATISAGAYHACGVTTGGAAYCWGSNGFGEVGRPAPTVETTPVLVSDDLTFATVSAGQGFTCGLTTGGAGYCWVQWARPTRQRNCRDHAAVHSFARAKSPDPAWCS